MTHFPLHRAKSGDRAFVASVDATDSRVERLAAMGILPGVELVVLQTQPVVIVQVDETVLAMEVSLAESVQVATS